MDQNNKSTLNIIIKNKLICALILNKFSHPCMNVDVSPDVRTVGVVDTVSSVYADVIIDVVEDIGVEVLRDMNLNVLEEAMAALYFAMPSA